MEHRDITRDISKEYGSGVGGVEAQQGLEIRNVSDFLSMINYPRSKELLVDVSQY